MSGATFIDGIGPPLEQIQDDHTPSDTQEDKDILALISEIARLTAALEASGKEARDLSEVATLAQELRHTAEQRVAELEATLWELRAATEPLGVDISDYGDEWCAGFLAGQENAYEFIARAALSASESGEA